MRFKAWARRVVDIGALSEEGWTGVGFTFPFVVEGEVVAEVCGGILVGWAGVETFGEGPIVAGGTEEDCRGVNSPRILLVRKLSMQVGHMRWVLEDCGCLKLQVGGRLLQNLHFGSLGVVWLHGRLLGAGWVCRGGFRCSLPWGGCLEGHAWGSRQMMGVCTVCSLDTRKV
jgi:hypothetical protein